MLNDDPLATALGEVRRATRDQVTAVWQSQMERLREVLSRDYREQMARVIDDRFTDFEATLKPRILEARREVVRSLGRHWHECFLRMRSAENDREWCDALLDAAGGLSKRCAFFSVKGEAIYYQGARGFEQPPYGIPPEIAVQSAPAFLEVVLSGVSAETSRSARDLSAPLANAFGDPNGSARLVPVSTDDRVVGVIYVEQALEPASVEAVALVAGIVLSRRINAPEALRPSTVVRSITEEPAPAGNAEVRSTLVPRPAAQANPQAARAARVAASHLLLDRYEAVKAGRAAGDVYSPLKTEIDALRQNFKYPPEILDTELIRTLAKGNPELLRS